MNFSIGKCKQIVNLKNPAFTICLQLNLQELLTFGLSCDIISMSGEGNTQNRQSGAISPLSALVGGQLLTSL
jgi:hypothetical protein